MEPYQQLEKAIEAKFKVPNVVACSSGTAALHLALESLRLPQGSKVIVPDLTMIACARAVTLAGLTPVFVDCGDDLLMDDGEPFGNATVEPYSAFMAVHVYGRQMDMDWIASTAGVYHPMIEDMAEAPNLRPHPETCAACYSFYRNKIVHGEEGGAVSFLQEEHADLARQLRSLGFTSKHDFMHLPRGHNYRMSNLHAVPIIDSLNRLDANLYLRQLVEQWYIRETPPEWLMPPRQSPWVYDIRIPGMDYQKQDALVKYLWDNGVSARHCFKPMSVQPEYQRMPQSPNAVRLSQEVLYMPIEPEMPCDRVKKNMNTVKAFFG